MAKPIPMPPNGKVPMNWIFHVKLTEQIELVVNDAGFFDRLTDGFFDPDLPRGHQPHGTIGPLRAKKEGDAVIAYFDEIPPQPDKPRPSLFLVTIRISA